MVAADLEKSGFSPELFRFLRELERNNERKWFERNRDRYELFVRQPMLKFIAELRPALSRISAHFVADPKPVGGSMMRIHRDLRFSADKTPYKTSIGAHFWHAQGKEGACPAFYLHIEPGKSALGAGIWRPEPGALKQIRLSIATRSTQWKRITSARDFRSTCRMVGEHLQRPPPGFDPDDPMIEDIKRKDFATSSSIDDREVCSPDFPATVMGVFRRAAPFVRFLSDAIGLPF